MNAIWILQWWNLVFIIPFGLALLYLGVYVFTGIGAEHDADAHLETDADVDADAEVDADAHAELDTGADADADAQVEGHTELTTESDHDLASGHDADAEGENDDALGFTDVLIWLGVGRAPLSLVLMVLAMLWGMAGFFANQILAHAAIPEWIIPLVSLPVAAVVSLMGTRVFARTIAKYMPMIETAAKRTHDLVGNVGEVLARTDEKFGLVQVRARSGDLFQMPCRVPEGRPAIDKGTKVLLVDYDSKERCFCVVPDELGNTSKP
jgi:membrane protein implicated in regulation of membrane protease activity